MYLIKLASNLVLIDKTLKFIRLSSVCPIQECQIACRAHKRSLEPKNPFIKKGFKGF